MDLFDFFKQKMNLSEDLEEALMAVFKTETFAKGEKVINPNNFSKKIYFLESGLAKVFYLKDGKEITHSFFSENAFYLTIDSIFYNRESPYGYAILEKSVVKSCYYSQIENLIAQFPMIESIIRMLLIDAIQNFAERLNALQFQTATERYYALLHSHPEIFKKAPLGDIASYLGITQQRLSVIRAQKL